VEMEERGHGERAPEQPRAPDQGSGNQKEQRGEELNGRKGRDQCGVDTVWVFPPQSEQKEDGGQPEHETQGPLKQAHRSEKPAAW